MVWETSSQITRFCIFIDVIVKNIINRCFRSWSMTSRDIYMWEETIEADTIKKLVIRIIRIVVYEIRLMLNYPIRYASLFSLEIFSKLGIRILLNSCIDILWCLYMHWIIQFFLVILLHKCLTLWEFHSLYQKIYTGETILCPIQLEFLQYYSFWG